MTDVAARLEFELLFQSRMIHIPLNCAIRKLANQAFAANSAREKFERVYDEGGRNIHATAVKLEAIMTDHAIAIQLSPKI